MREPKALRRETLQHTADRFWSRVDRNAADGCWPWQGQINSRGYPVFNGLKAPLFAHRVAFVLTVRDLEAGETIDHRCSNPICCNPAHHEPVSKGENTHRMMRGRMSDICPNGHAYDRVYIRNGRPVRHCTQCTLDWQRKHRDEINARRRAKRRQEQLEAATTGGATQ